MNFSAVILAGGRSSRMGRDKAWLEVDGRPLLARQIQIAVQTGAREIFISGREEADYSGFGHPVLRDLFVGAGPLAGIERALDAAAWPLVLVLAVDLPQMDPEFLRGLGADAADEIGVVPRLDGRIEPLAAYYPRKAQPLAARRLREQRLAAAGFAERCVQSGLARWTEVPEPQTRCFANWNTPDDLASGRGTE